MDNYASRQSNVNGHHPAGPIKLAMETFGANNAPAVLLTHGFGQTRHAWRHTAQALAASGWRAVSYDARGHGDSGRPRDGTYQLDDFVDDFRRVIEALGEKPVVVGASMGGLITMLAQAEPPSVELSALVLVDIAPRWQRQGVERMLGFMQQHADGFASLDQARQAVQAYLPHRQSGGGGLKRNLRQDNDGHWRWHWDPRMLEYANNGALHQERIAAAARCVKAPTLLVSGGQTDMISSEHINELLDYIPHAKHVVVPNAAHMVAGDDNDRFNAAITTFISEFNHRLPMEA